ncbi:MAG: hypothetical protein HRT45_11900 [Bdellovibrionales bacterium]|nr:hypothetical protein [Bdellovibrionales bacterium]
MRAAKAKIITVTLSLFLMVACEAPDEFSSGEARGDSGRLTQLDLEELTPNALFLAVYNDDLAEVKTIVAERSDLLSTLNTRHGELPLAMAIREKRKEIAEFLVSVQPVESFESTNKYGESVILLVARNGWHRMVFEIGKNAYFSKRWNEIYSFRALDIPNNQGQRAMSYARDSKTMDALKEEYKRGVGDVVAPFYSTYHSDNLGNLFLHQAAKDGRIDVIRWSLSEACEKNFAERAENGIVSGFSRGATWLGRYAREWVQYPHWVNWENQEGKTPLHVAIEAGQYEASRALLSCRWSDPLIQDDLDQSPLHVLLHKVDQRQARVSPSVLRLVRLLAAYDASLRPFTTQASLLDLVDNHGDSALHMAARLADPEVFQLLKAYGGDILQLNELTGERPVDAFLARHPNEEI